MKSNSNIRAVTFAAVTVGLLYTAMAYPAEEPAQAASLADAITGGKLLLNLRPRYELVDQDGKPEDAKAFTLRSLVGWETKPWHSFSLTAQAINVSRLGSLDYNDDATKAAASRFPLVADPDDSDINPSGTNLGFTDIISIASNGISISSIDAGIIVFRTPTPTRTPTPINLGNFV